MSIHNESQPYSFDYDPQGTSIFCSRWESDKDTPRSENAMKMVKVEMRRNGDVIVSTFYGELTETRRSFWDKILGCFKPKPRNKFITRINARLPRLYFSHDRITPQSADIDIQNSQLRDDICDIFKNSPNVNAIQSKIEKCIKTLKKENQIKLQQIQQLSLENINKISLPINNRIENASAILQPQLDNNISDLKEQSISEPQVHSVTPKNRDLKLMLNHESNEIITIADLISILRDPDLAACFSMEIRAGLEKALQNRQEEMEEAEDTVDIDEVVELLLSNAKKVYNCIKERYQMIEKGIHDNLINNANLPQLTKAGLRVFEQQLSDFRKVMEDYNNLSPLSVSKPNLLHMIELIKVAKLVWHIE